MEMGLRPVQIDSDTYLANASVKSLEAVSMGRVILQGYDELLITYANAVSHVARIQQLKPKTERNPNRRCTKTFSMNWRLCI